MQDDLKNQIAIEECRAVEHLGAKFIYNTKIGRDITLRKKAERDMMQALEKEKELRHLKSRFLYIKRDILFVFKGCKEKRIKCIF